MIRLDQRYLYDVSAMRCELHSFLIAENVPQSNGEFRTEDRAEIWFILINRANSLALLRSGH